MRIWNEINLPLNLELPLPSFVTSSKTLMSQRLLLIPLDYSEDLLRKIIKAPSINPDT